MQSNASYDNEAMALNDLIDNSLDANASEVNILLVTGGNRTPDDYSLRDSGRERPDRISAILVQDNGTGMADGFTRAACAYGWSSKKDKKTLGTFGFGVKNAGIAFGSRLEVYSKNKMENGNSVILMWMNLQMRN